ncbi:cell division protein FtsA [Candidatus Hydrogenosomobacter endosymbioticus]|nr:cell division protein FtsA [Candidatus Hydrogenosomobacter endosymbioticus]
MKSKYLPGFSSIRRHTVAAVDIGSSKVCCWIANIDDKFRIFGSGRSLSRGFSCGRIVDIPSMEADIALAVDSAESAAKTRIHEVVLSINFCDIASRYSSVRSKIQDGIVKTGDVSKIIEQAMSQAKNHSTLHVLATEFSVDDQRNVKNPVGMIGNTLYGNIHTVHCSLQMLSSVYACFNRRHISIKDVAASGYCAGLACTVNDEQDLGITVIDIGHSSTTVTSFFEKNIVFCGFVPIGGSHITQDIARGLDTSIAHAERLKILYGAAIPSQDDHKEVLSVETLGDSDDQTSTVSRSFLINVIQARTHEILSYSKAQLEKASSICRFAASRIALTGGTSRLPGIREQAIRILESPVRIAKPLYIEDAPSLGGEFSAIAGALMYAKSPSFQKTYMGVHTSKNPFSSLSSLLKRNL